MSSLSDTGGTAKLASVLETYMRLGGQQVQVNIIDTETLREAQAHPEAHRDLVVRVAGFSAYFTDLSRDVQDEIISRNAHEI
jgi:formate C-acetyltransferase